MIPELYPYQIEAIELLVQKFKEGKKAILLVIPGGGGKTIIASKMILDSKHKGNRTLFKAHRRELIKQCQQKLSKFGVDAAIIMSGEEANEFSLVQVASIQTLSRRELPPAKLVIIDEAHRSLSPQYLRIIGEYKAKGAYIIGLTGTPFRTNKRERLAGFYDDYVANIKSTELITGGFICSAKVYGSDKISSKSMKSRGGEFRDDELMKAFDTENTYINLISNFEKLAKDKKTIVFACSVPHSIKCTQEFLMAGYKAAHVDGNTPEGERDRIIKAFGSGEIQVLVNYGILAEGFDVPDCECVILALATKSKIKYYQACWRANRQSPGKKEYIVIDMADNCERFGFPDEDIEVSLEAEDNTESSGVSPVKICPCCSYMNHASVKACKDCNTEFKKTEKEIKEEQFVEIQRERKERAWKRYTLKDLYKVKDEDLEEYGRFKKYKPMWAKIQLQKRKENKKPIKIKDFPEGTKEYYKKTAELEKAYYGDKAINAEEFVFLEENKSFVVFQYVKKKEEETI